MEIFDFYDTTNLKSYNLDKNMQYQLSMLDRLDVYTRRHSESVADLACRICEYLHCDKSFTEYCTICAYLHDIGKLFIPREILTKKEPLTEEELNILKQHPVHGYNMCMKDRELQPYHVGAYYHHEALDGSGYPQGLTKKDIPFEAQIIRVADEFDSIVSSNNYTSHVGISNSLQILVDTSTTHNSDNYTALDAISKNVNSGKNNPKIVKALFRVIIDNIEYEIYCTNNYITDLKDELKRCSEVDKYIKKLNSATDENNRTYFMDTIKFLLKPNEKFEDFDKIKEQYQNAYQKRKDIIDNLYLEIKKLKKLRQTL